MTDQVNIAVLPFLKWAASHMDQFKAIPDDTAAIQAGLAAHSLPQAWGASKTLGDLVVNVLGDCPLLPADWQNVGEFDRIVSKFKADSNAVLFHLSKTPLGAVVSSPELGKYGAVGDGTLLKLLAELVAMAPQIVAAIQAILDMIKNITPATT